MIQILLLDSQTMDKIMLTGQNLVRVFNSRLGRACIRNVIVDITKQPNLKLKTWSKQLLGYLPLAFVLPKHTDQKRDLGKTC
jgi:hypothetical protein